MGVLVGLLALAAFAQGQSTSLGGSVVDRWERAIPQAKLTLTNSQTGAALTETSTVTGGFLFSQVPPGSYDLSVRAEGFKLYTRYSVEIGSVPSSLDVRMDREKEVSGSIKDLETVASKKPGDYLAHFNLGRAYFAIGETEKAVHEIQEALKLKGDYLPAKFILAQLALRAPCRHSRCSPRSKCSR